MAFNVFNYINIAIVAIIIIPHIIASARGNNPLDGITHKIAAYLFQMGQSISMALMILPLMVKDGQFVLSSTRNMWVWLFMCLILLIIYIYFWISFFTKGNSFYTFTAITVIPAVIFLDTGMRFMHILLIIFAIIDLIASLILVKDYKDKH